MNLDTQVALWAIGTIAVIAGGYADTRRQVTELRNKVDGHLNGNSPYQRKDEAELVEESIRRDCHRNADRIEQVSKRTHRHSTTITTHSLALSEIERRLDALERKP